MRSTRIVNDLIITLLCRFNQNILKQKQGLMDLLVDKYGIVSTLTIYQRMCPLVHASIGQHFRHSLDHIERAVDAAAIVVVGVDNNNVESLDDTSSTLPVSIEYDLRTRGSTDEIDWNIAVDRIHHIHDKLESIKQCTTVSTLQDKTVIANFMLSGIANDRYPLTSTVGRELGFAGHHAIHHMAMVRTIVSYGTNEQQQLLSNDELPLDFGKAPSTTNFEHNLHSKETRT